MLQSRNDQKHLEPLWGCSRGDVAFQWCLPLDELPVDFEERETEAQCGWGLAEGSGEARGICGSPVYG